jgi:hypothetical protein
MSLTGESNFLFEDPMQVGPENKRAKAPKWSNEETKLLNRLAKLHNEDWAKISNYFQGRTPSQLEKRYL